jgi:hypothetical protein
MIPQYLNLKAGARSRLVQLKNAAAYTNAPDVLLPPSLRFSDWRAARVETFRTLSPELSQGFNSSNGDAGPKTPVWYSHAGEIFRDEQNADRVARRAGSRSIEHTGWFVDSHQEGTIRGIVARLSHGRFIAGTLSSENDERVYFDAVYTDALEAAQAADSEAQHAAEREREYNDRRDAAQDLATEIAETEREIAELFPMRHHARARRELVAAVETLRTKRAELENEYSDIEL